MFESLKHRNCRLFLGGQLISFTGKWMQFTAQSWLVYRLTHDPFALGFVGFLTQLPVLLLSTFGGAVADRVDRKTLVLVTQALSLLQASALAFLTLTGRIEIWHVYCLGAFIGVVHAFEFPTRQVFVGELVPAASRHNAIALHSSIVHATRVVGPAVAGILVGLVGEGVCFFVNAATYVPVILAIALIRLPRAERDPKPEGALAGIRRGVAYALGGDAIRLLLGMVAIIGLAGLPVTLLMPVFADEILHAGPRGLGFLLGAAGVGATAGALYLARRKDTVGLERILAWAPVLFGCALISFSFSRVFWLSCLCLCVGGWSMIVQIAGMNTMLQELSESKFRGRIMGLFTMLFFGFSPFGSFFSGALAARFGAPLTLSSLAVLCILAGCYAIPRLPSRVQRHRAASSPLPPDAIEPN